MTPRAGETISHYLITGEIAAGGMGTVFQATDLRLNRTVALKFLPRELTRDQGARDRLIHEARAASSIQHKNICVIHDIDWGDDDNLFISMEYLEGVTLKQRLASGAMPVEETLNLSSQIAEGLAQAHQQGVVHRDLTPANVIITREKVVKLLDFGLADAGEVPHGGRVRSDAGTAAYMSPEQARSEPVDARTDIWSLGVLLYEMLTGRHPFGSEYLQAILYALANETQRPVRELRPEAPAALERIVDRCLAKDRDGRPQSAAMLLAELRKVKQSPAGRRETGSKAIAVLPFADISPEQDNTYFSDGLTEEIIGKLSCVRTMKVIPRTTVMSYDRTGKLVGEIAAELGARYLLEGAVRKAGLQLRITTRLIDPAQEGYVWTESFDGTMDEVFEIQEKVASRIVKALKLRISPDEKRGLNKRPTENSAAYQLYLQGRSYWNRRSRESLEKALRYFEQAIEEDPGYALAWAGIADVYNLIAEYTGAPRNESNTRAQAAIRKALELNPNMAEAHATLGIMAMLNDWDWAAAEREFKLSISLNPQYATAHHWYAEMASMQGRVGEAILSIARATELAPGIPGITKDKGMILYYARDFDGAVEQGHMTLAADPNFAMAHRLLTLAYHAQGKYAEAIAENQIWGKLTGKKSEAEVTLALCMASSGKSAEALDLLRKIERTDDDSGNLYRGIALVYAALGNPDAAFAWLDKGMAVRADSLCTIRVDPKVDRLRGDPRFDRLLTMTGLA